MKAKKKRILWVVTILLIVAGGLYYFMFGTSNEGVIIPQNASKAGKPLVSGPKQLNAQHIQLTYLGSYLQNQLPAKDIDLEIYKLSASTTYEKGITVIVSKLPAGGLSQNSGYMLRKSRPDMYVKRPATVSGRSVEVYVSVNGQEQTVFVTQNNKVAVLAFVQRGGDVSGLSTEVDTLLQTFAWR